MKNERKFAPAININEYELNHVNPVVREVLLYAINSGTTELVPNGKNESDWHKKVEATLEYYLTNTTIRALTDKHNKASLPNRISYQAMHKRVSAVLSYWAKVGSFDISKANPKKDVARHQIYLAKDLLDLDYTPDEVMTIMEMPRERYNFLANASKDFDSPLQTTKEYFDAKLKNALASENFETKKRFLCFLTLKKCEKLSNLENPAIIYLSNIVIGYNVGRNYEQVIEMLEYKQIPVGVAYASEKQRYHFVASSDKERILQILDENYEKNVLQVSGPSSTSKMPTTNDLLNGDYKRIASANSNVGIGAYQNTNYTYDQILDLNCPVPIYRYSNSYYFKSSDQNDLEKYLESRKDKLGL